MSQEKEGGNSEKGDKGMSKKNIIILIIAGFLVFIVMGAAFFILWNKVSSIGVQAEEDKIEETAEEVEVDKLGALLHLDTFIVNLADQDGKRFLRITLELELSGDKSVEEVEKWLSKIRDTILTILPNRKFEDIKSVEGKKVLRDEIIAKLNNFLGEGTIVNIYYTEFIVQ